MKRLLIISAFLTIYIIGIATEAHAVRQTVFSPQIKTLQAVVNQDWLSPPVMTLGSSDVLNVAFDELSHEYQRFTYHIEHCEADWTPSDELFESDYLEGVNDNPIDDWQNSINTVVLYTHYTLQIPNDRCRLKMGGNYRLDILDEDGGKVAEVRFMVLEPLMNVGLGCTTNTDIDINRSHQQLTMSVGYGPLRVTNPSQQLRTVVTQNDRDDNARLNTRPDITNGTGLEWRHCRDLIFDAGNEYHKYEVLDVTHPTMGIDRIVWDGDNYNVFPFASTARRNYLYDVDANGSFYIRNSDNTENDYTTEYVFVHYRLNCEPMDGGRLVIDGRWTTDDNLNTYLMQYDEEDMSYKATVMQKQGYYSYQYLLLRDDGTTAIPPSEGSYHQTENRYQAYVYYRGNGERTWRLVGYRQAESTTR